MATPGDHGRNVTMTDVATLRRNARAHIERGAVTQSYAGDRQKVLGLLNNALATELVCVLRYRRHYFMAKGLSSKAVAEEFLEHSNEELGHADQIAERIVQLGGSPDWSPDSLSSRSHAEYVEGNSLLDMIREDLVAERVAIDSYREFIDYLGDSDSTTRRMLEEILRVEEDHANELSDLLDQAGDGLVSERARRHNA
jgi:bacterioferritin